MTALAIHNLCKTYKNGVHALDDVSITIQEGEFVALLGPNGAGKTTLINTLVGNVQKTSGSVQIGSYDIDYDHFSAKRTLGVVPQEVSYDSFFTVNELLKYQSGYFGIANNQERIDHLLEKLSLIDKKHTNSRMLSGGMKRRLLIAKTLVHDPSIFILDEPTAGVDIELRNSLYAFLQEIHKSGKTIILTTHYLEEAEKLCDRIIVINEGKVVADKPKEELTKSNTLEEVFLHLTHR